MVISEAVIQLETVLIQTEDASRRVQLIVDLLNKYLHFKNPQTNPAQDILSQLTQLAESSGFTDELMEALIKTVGEHRPHNDYNQELAFWQKCFAIADKHNYPRHKAISHRNIGKLYERISKTNDAIAHYNSALSIYETLGNEVEIAGVLNSLGNCYSYQDNNALALEYCLKALALFESLNDQYNLGIIFNSLGNIYLESGDLPQGLEYHLKSLKTTQQIDDKEGGCFFL